eukprot:TRINITY_DN13493_c0_g1_i1.p1 TRINITY_DN13493_c0_g1~~TRINITY_DN13493_c0_g1_i1.p1  ORF type:complete len:593 (-),score=83.23 TRINITY_DN13493_c0_g1_i1:350-2128(-)
MSLAPKGKFAVLSLPGIFRTVVLFTACACAALLPSSDALSNLPERLEGGLSVQRTSGAEGSAFTTAGDSKLSHWERSGDAIIAGREGRDEDAPAIKEDREEAGEFWGAYEKHWPPLEFSWKVVLATVMAFIGAGLANAGGIGGGPLFVPLFNLLLGFDAKTSTALSKAMVFGGAMASLCFNVRLRHPTKERALINYDAALLFQPLLLLGISLGVTCNVAFPGWLIKILLVILLALMSHKTLKKGVSTWKQESKLAAAAKAKAPSLAQPLLSNEASSDHSNGQHPTDKSGIVVPVGGKSPHEHVTTSSHYVKDTDFGVHVENAEDAERGVQTNGQTANANAPSAPKGAFHAVKEFLRPAKSDRPTIPLVNWHCVACLVCLWGLYLTLQISRMHVPLCGVSFWLLTFIQIPASLLMAYHGGRRLLAIHETRLSGTGPQGAYRPDEIQWGLQQIATAPAYALIAGTMGGLLGVGGGIVMGPVLLELGLQAQETAATSSFLILFSSSMSVLEFYLLDCIPITTALYFAFVCLVAAFFGLSLIRALVTWSGKASIVIFVLGSFIGISSVVILILGGFESYEDWTSGVDMGFTNICAI